MIFLDTFSGFVSGEKVMSNRWANLRAKHYSNKTSMISKQEFKSWKYLEITSEWELWENGDRTIVSDGAAGVALKLLQQQHS